LQVLAYRKMVLFAFVFHQKRHEVGIIWPYV
jgi:hypothetical protein